MKYLILVLLTGCAPKKIDLSHYKFRPSSQATLMRTEDLSQCNGPSYEDIDGMSWCESKDPGLNHYSE